jgi:hypothetical protein
VLAGQRHFGVFTRTKRKRVNGLQQIHSLALRAGIPPRFEFKVALSSQAVPDRIEWVSDECSLATSSEIHAWRFGHCVGCFVRGGG